MVKKRKSETKKKPCDSVMVKKRKSAATKHCVQEFLDKDIESLYHRLQEVTANRVKEQFRFEKLEFQLTEIGYIFSPEDGILVVHYLSEKIMYEDSGFYFIKEADVYGTHPLNLIEIYPAVVPAGNVWYFFTRSRPNGTSEGGNWIFGEEMNILYQGNKVGVKQLLEYCEGGRKTGYKIDEYRVESPPDNLKKGPWFICKLYKDESCEDVHSPGQHLEKVQELLDEEVERLLGHLNVMRTEMIKQLDKDDAKATLHNLIDREMARLRRHMNIVSMHNWGCTFEEAEMRLASIGFIFSPEDGILVHHYLRKKCLSLRIPLNSIKEAVVYGTHRHPLNLIEDYPAADGKVWYFFTRSRPNGTSEGGHWIFGEEMNILYQGNKVGVKQLLEYCEGGRKTEYKIDEYRVESPPDNLKKGPWFLCKLYKDESCEDVQS